MQLRVREKAHIREGDAIAAARRRLPMVEVDADHAADRRRTGRVTLLDAFEGRRQLIAYYFMWHTGHPAAEQCEGCTWSPPRSRSCPTFIHATSPTRCSVRGRTTKASATATSWAGTCRGTRRKTRSTRLLVGRHIGLMHLVCYLRDGDRVFETYWTNYSRRRGDGLQLRAHGPHRVRTPGAVGGLAARLAGRPIVNRQLNECGPTDGPSPSGRASEPGAPTS